MSFLSLRFVTTSQSTDLCPCLQKVHVSLCPSGASNALQVGGEGLGGCFLSEVVEGVVTIELYLSRASTSVLNTLSNSSRFQFPVSNFLLITNLSFWGTLLRRTVTSKLPYCRAAIPKACKPLMRISVLSYNCLIPLTSLIKLTTGSYPYESL